MLLSGACTSKLHVRLYSEHLTEEDVVKVSNALEAANIRFSNTTVRMPRAINDNTIIYTPAIDQNQQIYYLVETLSSVGFSIHNSSILGVGNHSFTANNLGLYLFSEGTKRKALQDDLLKIDEFGSVECGSVLTLKENNTFDIVFDIWDHKRSDYIEYLVTGTWQDIGSGDISLTSEGWRNDLKFIRKTTIESTEEGKLKTIILTPVALGREAGFYLDNDKNQPDVNCYYRTSMFI
ncbi:hypothetical protein [Thalassotalea ganghwensis]